MPLVDIIIRIEKSDTVTDMPRGQKTTTAPGYVQDKSRKPITTERRVVEEKPATVTETIDRIGELESDSKRVIAGAKFVLEELSSRMKGKSISVDYDVNPELIQALNYLYGDGGHNNEITFDMYTQLIKVIQQYGREKALGNI